MGRRSRQLHANNKGVTHYEQYDDSILPAPVELERYQQINGVLDFILDTAGKEQQERHNINRGLLAISQSDAEVRKLDAEVRAEESRRTFRLNVLGLVLGTLIILVTLTCGVYLLYLEKNLPGYLLSIPSIFALLFRAFVPKRDASRARRPA